MFDINKAFAIELSQPQAVFCFEDLRGDFYTVDLKYLF